MIYVDYYYDHNLGRKMFESEKRYFEKITSTYFIEKNTKNFQKTPKRIDLLILSLNSVFQNDIFSGINLFFNTKRLICNIKRKFLLIKILKHTNQFQNIFQKIITGNPFKINYFIFSNVLSYHLSDNIAYKVMDVMNMIDYYDIFKRDEKEFSGIFFFFKSNSEYKKEIKNINFFLNGFLWHSLFGPKLKIFSHYPYIPFYLNCPFYLMEFFAFKLLFFYQITLEHFGLKLYPVLRSKSNKGPICYSNKNLEVIFSRSFDLVTLLLIFQSIETLNLYGRIIVYKRLMSHRKLPPLNLNCHPIEISIVKKIKSCFFF